MNKGDHRIRVSSDPGASGERARKVIDVTAKTLDQVMAGVDEEPALIWMDTQGYEGHVLAGGERTIARSFLEF